MEQEDEDLVGPMPPSNLRGNRPIAEDQDDDDFIGPMPSMNKDQEELDYLHRLYEFEARQTSMVIYFRHSLKFPSPGPGHGPGPGPGSGPGPEYDFIENFFNKY